MSVSVKYSMWDQYPAYNIGIWAFDSTLKTEADMYYVIDVYSASNYINRYSNAPRPEDGYGLFQTSCLSPFINQSKDVHPTSNDWFWTPNSYVKYNLSLGTQLPSWRFTDNFYYLTASTGYVGFTSTTQQHDFTVGQQIYLSQDLGFTNPSYEGLATVLYIENQYMIVIDKLFASSTGAEGGYVKKSNGKPIIITGQTTTQNNYLYGSSLTRDEISTYNADNWVINRNSSVNANILTDMPNSYRMRYNSRMFFPIPNFSSATSHAIFTAYAENGDQVGQYRLDMPTPIRAKGGMSYLSCGPYDLSSSTGLTVVSGSSSPISLSTSTYTIQVWNTGNTLVSETISVKLDHQELCDDMILLFMDKKGAFCSLALKQKWKKSIDNKKKTYNKLSHATFDGTQQINLTHPHTYDVYNTVSITKIIGTSSTLSQSEMEYAMQIYSSPIVYWMVSPTNWVPVVVSDVEQDVITTNLRKAKMIDVPFTVAYNNNINW